MYKEHPIFEPPEDQNAKIWRYLDFTKFVSLMDRKAVFFVRADQLGDPFEGSSSKANVVLRPHVYGKEAQGLIAQIPIIVRAVRQFTVVSCWHMNEHESAAMWKLYLKSDEGVAIQSTFKRLTECFATSEESIYIGKVRYIDYERDWLPGGNTFYPFIHKRKSFEHEKELRAIIQELPIQEGKGVDWTKELFREGLYVPANLDALFEKIYVSPTAPDWFYDLVRSVLQRFSLQKEVIRSSLAEGPVY